MQIDRADIEAGLLRKGFFRGSERDDHRSFHFVFQGRRAGIHTFTSHGSKYKVYGDQLLNMMKRQLHLQTARDLADLVNCPMSREQYEQILRDQGLLG